MPIIDILLKCPKEHGSMGGMIGLQYEALKDFVTWGTPSGYSKRRVQEIFIPQILNYANIFASLINNNK